MFAAYRAAAEGAGRNCIRDDLAIRRAVVVDPDERVARRLGCALADEIAGFEGLSSLVTDDDVIAGTSDQVFEQIAEQCDRTGAGHILLFGSCHMPADEYLRIIEIYGAEVLPRLLEAGTATQHAAAAE
jgi:alkanesulfonate monooxygenase SsuD/methylene tetrahydromethanopterin reductase-like flavin-dependent oxidoreductase (luciferase family)